MKLVLEELDPEETLLILKSNTSIFMSWGVELVFSEGGMKVNGHHHKEWVLITLGWDDWYRVHILSDGGEVLDSYSEVCFDELVQIINDRIELVEEYKFLYVG